MKVLDFEDAPAQYVAQNLIFEIGENSELTYEEEVLDDGFITGPNSFEEQGLATQEGYQRESH